MVARCYFQRGLQDYNSAYHIVTPILRMSVPSINQDALEEVSLEEKLQCPLKNGRHYRSLNFSSDEKRVVVKRML